MDKMRPTKKCKLSTVVVAVLLAIALVITGTLAWESSNAQAQIIIMAATDPAGGRLHDDFEVVGPNYGTNTWKDGFSANKDIYVENYESASNGGKEIFARVKLYEYMEVGTGATLDKTLQDGSVNPQYMTREAKALVAQTSRDDVGTWIARLPDKGNKSDVFKSRFEWGYGGQKTYMPTFNKDSASDEIDAKGNALSVGALGLGELKNTTLKDEVYAYSKDAGTHDFFVTNNTHTAKEKYWDANSLGTGAHAMTNVATTHKAQLTSSGSVITMDEWKDTPYESAPGNYWVIDKDGWAYWADAIAPESATGLLLDTVTLKGAPDEDFYYSIYVKAEMATAKDWTKESDTKGFYRDISEAPSTDAEQLLRTITGYNPEVVAVYLDQSMAAVGVNDTLNLNASIDVKNTLDPNWQAINWSISPSVGSRFAGGIFSPATIDANTWYTITAKSAKDPTKFATCMVYVPDASFGVVDVIDGDNHIYYLDNKDNTYKRIYENNTFGNLVCPIKVGSPGLSTDRSNVVQINNIRYLDEGDSYHYYAYGADGLLGTADDVLVFDSDNAGTMLPAQTAVTISINPNPAEVKRGRSLVLSASATLDSLPQDTSGITWLIIGAHSSNTTITGTGTNATLNVDALEANTTLNVRATYPGKYGASMDVSVAVKSTFNNVIPDDAKTFTDSTGVVWRIIKDNRPGAAADSKGIASTGDGTVLIVTDKVYGTGGLINYGNGFSYNGSRAAAAWVPYSNATIKSEFDNWYNANVSPELKAGACIPNLTYENTSAPDTGFSSVYNLDKAMSSAGSAADSTTSGIVFPLSISEANRYLGSTAAARGALDVSGTGQIYWLRSAGATVPYYGSIIRPNGAIGNGNLRSGTFAMRPAMWIDVIP